MSSKGYAAPLRIEVGANPRLRVLYLGMLFCASVALLILPLPMMIRFMAVALLWFLAKHVWHQRAELGGEVVQLIWDSDEQWWWKDKDEQTVTLMGDSFLSPRLLVLNFRIDDAGQHRSLVLTPKAVGAETFRRMVVRFRITPKDSSQAQGW